ncbi:MAG: TetR/AcrR family transcriptional regulator [Candidatus Cryptobacteroides sp.]
MKNDTNIEQHIIESAREVFLEKGYVETSMGDIAEKAGINRSGLHYYFRTKDRMFEAVFSDIISSFLPSVRQVFLDDLPIEQRIRKVVDIYFDTLMRNPQLPMFVLKEVQRDSRLLLDTMKRLVDGQFSIPVEEALNKEMAEGHIRSFPIQFIIYEYYGLMFAPFIAKPLTDILFNTSEEEFVRNMELWKSQVEEQMCRLLCV